MVVKKDIMYKYKDGREGVCRIYKITWFSRKEI